MVDTTAESGLTSAGLRATATVVAGVIAATKFWLGGSEHDGVSHNRVTRRTNRMLVFMVCGLRVFSKRGTNNYL